jgi:acyl dehydratase
MKDHSKLIGKVLSEQVVDLTMKDTLLYALSLGFGADPLNVSQLRYVYESNTLSLPGMAMIIGYPGFWMKEPEYGFEWQKALHAEESITVHNPLPTEGKIFAKTIVENVVDRGSEKGCFVYMKKELYTENKSTHLATVVSNTLARGDGGFGGGGTPRAAMPASPAEKPSITCDLATLPQSALLYRLSGDMNPLHADPQVARSVGFSGPILHGRCTMGVAMHALIKSCCDYDASRLESMEVRFSSPFMPGETLRTEIWGNGKTIQFKATALERNVVVLNNGNARVKQA